jgi:hypothetical protein
MWKVVLGYRPARASKSVSIEDLRIARLEVRELIMADSLTQP